MNQSLKILLEGRGFRQRNPQSCEFWKVYAPFQVGKNYVFRVWLHRNGGQAEIAVDDCGRRIARNESWCSIEELDSWIAQQTGLEKERCS